MRRLNTAQADFDARLRAQHAHKKAIAPGDLLVQLGDGSLLAQGAVVVLEHQPLGVEGLGTVGFLAGVVRVMLGGGGGGGAGGGEWPFGLQEGAMAGLAAASFASVGTAAYGAVAVLLSWLPTFVNLAGGPKGDGLKMQIEAGQYPGIVKTTLDGVDQLLLISAIGRDDHAPHVVVVQPSRQFPDLLAIGPGRDDPVPFRARSDHERDAPVARERTGQQEHAQPRHPQSRG